MKMMSLQRKTHHLYADPVPLLLSKWLPRMAVYP